MNPSLLYDFHADCNIKGEKHRSAAPTIAINILFGIFLPIMTPIGVVNIPGAPRHTDVNMVSSFSKNLSVLASTSLSSSLPRLVSSMLICLVRSGVSAFRPLCRCLRLF